MVSSMPSILISSGKLMVKKHDMKSNGPVFVQNNSRRRQFELERILLKHLMMKKWYSYFVFEGPGVFHSENILNDKFFFSIKLYPHNFS